MKRGFTCEIDRQIIKENFERYWPDLEKDFESIKDITSKTKVPERATTDMLQELLELVREQSRANLERRINTDQKDRAEIIIKILKEGIYGTSDDIIGSPTYSANYYESSRSPFDKLHNMITRDRLEKELLDMALRVQ